MDDQEGCLRQIASKLEKAGYSVEEHSGVLEVAANGHQMGWVEPDGSCIFDTSTYQSDQHERCIEIMNIAKQVHAYHTLFSAAQPLDAKGVEDRYKKLAKFGGVVLAGTQMNNGEYQFVTWRRDCGGDHVQLGHYWGEDLEGAKEDFVKRAELLPTERLFSHAQLLLLYQSVSNTLEQCGWDLPDETCCSLEKLASQIEQALPDSVDLSPLLSPPEQQEGLQQQA